MTNKPIAVLASSLIVGFISFSLFNNFQQRDAKITYTGTKEEIKVSTFDPNIDSHANPNPLPAPGSVMSFPQNREEDTFRDPEEWQGMPVPKILPPCISDDGCGFAMACIDGKCAACGADSDCAQGEVCVLQHCLLEDKVSCKLTRECEKDDALCVLSGYSNDMRGNGEMHAFCRSSSSGQPQVEKPVERAKLDAARGNYQKPRVEIEDLEKGLIYDAK